MMSSRTISTGDLLKNPKTGTAELVTTIDVISLTEHIVVLFKNEEGDVIDELVALHPQRGKVPHVSLFDHSHIVDNIAVGDYIELKCRKCGHRYKTRNRYFIGYDPIYSLGGEPCPHGSNHLVTTGRMAI